MKSRFHFSLPTNHVLLQVYLLKNYRKVSKKRTSRKKGTLSPIYNEAMIFSVPKKMLSSIQIRLSVISMPDATFHETQLNQTIDHNIGHVIVGNGTNGKGWVSKIYLKTNIKTVSLQTASFPSNDYFSKKTRGHVASFT